MLKKSAVEKFVAAEFSIEFGISAISSYNLAALPQNFVNFILNCIIAVQEAFYLLFWKIRNLICYCKAISHKILSLLKKSSSIRFYVKWLYRNSFYFLIFQFGKQYASKLLLKCRPSPKCHFGIHELLCTVLRHIFVHIVFVASVVIQIKYSELLPLFFDWILHLLRRFGQICATEKAHQKPIWKKASPGL